MPNNTAPGYELTLLAAALTAVAAHVALIVLVAIFIGVGGVLLYAVAVAATFYALVVHANRPPR